MRAVLTREWRQEDDPGLADFVIQRLGELPDVINRLPPGARQADTYNEVTSRAELRGWVLEVGAVDFREYLKRKCREQNISLHGLAARSDLNQLDVYQAVHTN